MPSTISDWVDVQVRSSLDTGELLGLLDDPALQGAWQDEGITHLYWPAVSWSQDRLVRLWEVLQELTETGQPAPEILVQSIPNQDWNLQWAKSVRPIRIGRKIVIRPSWEPVALQPQDIEIVLDPKQAFGTGHHATTRMLLEWLEELVHGGESVLDVGSGSGILAMVAVRLGASSALEVECDPVAVDCAREYAVENGFGQELHVVCGTLSDISGQRSPHLVLANLDRQTLLLLCDDLAGYATRGARLLLSGILLDQEQEILEAYSKAGALLAQRREQEGWVALELLMGESCEGESR